MTDHIEIWVPGPWPDMRGYIEVQAQSTGTDFVAAGLVIMETATKRGVGIEFCPREPQLAEWMSIGSARAFDAKVVDAIDKHASIIKLRIEDGGAELAQTLLTFTGALKAAGGLGVRLARCGLAHPWSRWEQFLQEPGGSGLYRALVLQVPDAERARLSSFGMNQFGLPDAAFDGGDVDGIAAAMTVFAFNGYLREETPTLKDGHTFAYDEQAPVVRLQHEADDRYAVSDPYFNPHGVWVLTPVD